MQGDGNLVLYTQGRALWWTGTDGSPGATAVLQGDSNLVVYAPDGRPLWASNSVRPPDPGAVLYLQDDANIVTYSSAGPPVWASGRYNETLATNETLQPGWWLWSPQAKYRAVMQGDGNFVVYNVNMTATWASNTHGHLNSTVSMQSDGNLVVYAPGGVPVWNSQTNRPEPGTFRTVMQDDGNLVLYNAAQQPLWASIAGSLPSSSPPSVAAAAAQAAEARLGQVWTSENRNANYWSGWCETFVEVTYGNRFIYPSAIAQYNARAAAGQIRGGAPPRGAIVFWGGAGGAGHTGIGVGNGYVISTMGYTSDRLPVSRNHYTYFNLPYLGWAMPY